MIVKICVYVPVTHYRDTARVLGAIVKVAGENARAEIIGYLYDWRDVEIDLLYE